MKESASVTIDPAHPGFSDGFMSGKDMDKLYKDIYMDVHKRFIDSTPGFAELAE